MLAAALALVTAYAGTFSVSDRSEVRARTTVQTFASTPTQPAALSLDLLNQPIAALTLSDRRWDYTLGYSPSFILSDVIPHDQTKPTALFLNAGNAGIAWHERFVRLSLTEEATYSFQNTALLLGPGANGGSATTTPGTVGTAPIGQVSPLQPLAPPTNITLASSRTTLGAGLRLARRASLFMDVGYAFSGGVGDSRSTIPENYGPRADASLDVTASRRDHFITNASGSHSDFTNGVCPSVSGSPVVTIVGCAPQATIVQGGELWRHAIARATTLTLGAGASAVRARVRPTDPYATTAYPTADASLNQRFDARGLDQIDLTAQLAPAIDIRTGIVSQRIQGQVTALWALSPRVGLRVIGGAARSISGAAHDPLAFSLIRGEVEASYRATRQVDLSIGERSAWQSQDAFGSFFSTMAYFAVTVRAPALRF